jgi:hypothetical protein
VNVGFHIGSDRFLGHSLVQVNSGNDLEISFTNSSGNVRLLSSPTVVHGQGELPIAVTTGPRYIIDSALLTSGAHKIELVSCNWQTNACANRKDADRTEEAGALHQKPAGFYHKGDLIATLTPQDGSQAQSIYAPATGMVYFENAATIHTTDAGVLVAYVITAPRAAACWKTQ